ncbi:MAG: NTP transferase domain-containing protein [Methylophaga sp.]|nr:NTP transferase domain-containing protein [Methylophaga sp.]
MFRDSLIVDTLCLIPAKGCSTRLPRKNMLPLGGEPLISRTIKKALKSGVFKTVCVSTEDQEIAEVAEKQGADVPFMRPEILSHDPATIVDVVLHALEYYQCQGEHFERVCVLLPTAPFVTISDINNAMDVFNERDGNALLSVTTTEFPPYNAWLINGTENESKLIPCFPESPYRATKSTECPEAYRSNGAILIVNSQAIQNYNGYQSGGIIPYIMPSIRSLDIDTELEYQFAVFLYEAGSHEK